MLRNRFSLGNVKLENVRVYKYLGLVITPSGEIRSALEDLKCRGLKAYMNLRNKLGICFHSYPNDSIKLFDAIIKPILLYASDFWGCLSLPSNNPIEKLHLMFCKHLLGVHKTTTTDGVLMELGRLPLVIYAQKASIKNWTRISSNKANMLVTLSYNSAREESLEWLNKIRNCLEQNGMLNIYLGNEFSDTTFHSHNKVFQHLSDIHMQQRFARIARIDSTLRTYNLIKKTLILSHI